MGPSTRSPLTEDSLSISERRRDPDVPFIADNAVGAVLKIHVEVENGNASGALRQFSEHPRIQARFGESGYRVRIGYGLHVGWAIEGAIGSHYKIDVNYLSPDVSLASKMEEETKHYGVPVLFTEPLFGLLSSGAQRRCRKVDRISLGGDAEPMYLYTVDMIQLPRQLAPDTHVMHIDFEGACPRASPSHARAAMPTIAARRGPRHPAPAGGAAPGLRALL